MMILQTQRNIELLPKPNRYELILDDALPPRPLITAALGLIFHGDRFLMTKLTARGWDIPGGHIEAGEHPEQTVRREIFEETCVHVGDLQLFAYDKFTIDAPKPDGYRYPHPVSYQLFYWGRVAHMKPFAATAEAVERQLLPPAAARRTRWVQRAGALYEAALDRARR